MSQVWRAHAKHWQHIGSPLRPCAEDVETFRMAGQLGHTVLLGVTPELAAIYSNVTAIDLNPAMIKNVWPGDTDVKKAICGDWLHVPFAGATQGHVVGDGCPVLLKYPQQQIQFFEEVARVLRIGARLTVRVFVAPDVPEITESIFTQAISNQIGSFHAFKWRLAMSLVAESGTPNIVLNHIYSTFDEAFPNRALLSKYTGWLGSDIATIDAYCDSTVVYSFPNLKQLRAIVPPMLKEVLCQYGSYELAECCPVITWERI